MPPWISLAGSISSVIRVAARVLVSFGAIAVAWLSLAPQDAVPEIDLWDKLKHFAAYAVLACCGGFAFSPSQGELKLGILLFAYGCILEFAQVYIPGRSGNIEDALADGLGVMVGMGIVRVSRRRISSTIAAGSKQPLAD